MTRLSPSLYPAPSSPDGAHTPAGLTAKATTQSTNGPTCRDQFDAVTSVNGNEFASSSAPRTPPVGERSKSIQQAFERLNAPQMREDAYGALPPRWLMLLAAFVCLFTLLAADVLYSAFFQWMTGVSL